MESPLEEGGAPDILYPRRHLYPHPRDRQQKAGSTASRGRRARVTASLRRLAPRQMAGRSPATQPARQWGTLPGATRGDGFVPNRNPCPAALPAARLTGEQVRPPAVGPARWPGGPPPPRGLGKRHGQGREACFSPSHRTIAGRPGTMVRRQPPLLPRSRPRPGRPRGRRRACRPAGRRSGLPAPARPG